MKKYLFFLVGILFFANVNAQDFNETWPLSANQTPNAVTGTGAANITTPLTNEVLNGWNAATYSSSAQRVTAVSTPPTTYSNANSLYLEFTISPTGSNSLTINTISIGLGQTGGSGSYSAGWAYSINGGSFTDISTVPTVASGTTVTTTTVTQYITIPSTQNLRIRVFPYGTASTSRSLIIKNFILTGNASVPLYYRSKTPTTGNWNTPGTWETSTTGGVGTWSTSTTIPSNNDNTVDILNGDNVTVSANATADQVNINFGGNLTLSTGITLTIANGSGTDLQVNGTFTNALPANSSGGILTLNGTANIGDGGKYKHNFNSGPVISSNPNLTWHSNSTLEISGLTSYGGSATFFEAAVHYTNVRWNCANTTTCNIQSSLVYVDGNLQLSNTGWNGSAGKLRLNGSTQTTALTILGDLIIDGGTTFVEFANGSAASPYTYNLNLGGNWNQTAGTFSSNVGSGNLMQINFTGVSKFFTQTGTYTGTYHQITVKTGASLTLNNDLNIAASRSLTIESGASITQNSNLTIGTSALLTIAGSLNVGANTLTLNGPTIAGTPTFLSTTSSSNLGFGGTNAGPLQIPSSVTALNNLTLNNTNGTPATLNLNSNLALSGTLTMTSGNINCGANTLELGTSTATVGILAYTSGNIIGNFKRWIGAAGQLAFPVGTATNNMNALVTFTDLTPGSLTAKFIASNPGATGLPLADNSLYINNQFTEGYWSLVAGNSLASTDYALELTGSNFTSLTQSGDTRIIKRANAGSWSLAGAGTHVNAAGAVAKRTGLSGFSEFAQANVYTPALSDYFRSRATGDLNTAGTWEISPDGSTWYNSFSVPTASANTVTIKSPHTVTVTNSVNVDQVTIEAGAKVIVNSSQTLTVDNGTGDDLTVDGTLENSGTITNNGTVQVNNILQVNQGSWAGNTGTYAYGASGTLVFNNSSGSYGIGGGDTWWPSSSGPVNVTVAGAGGITMNTARTVSGVFQTASGVTNANNLTFNGTARINSGGYLTGTPTYGGSSTLEYNVTSYTTSNNEFPATGVNNVTITSPGGTNTVTLNGAKSILGQLAVGDHTVNGGQSITAGTITIGAGSMTMANITTSGAFTCSGASAINLSGNWSANSFVKSTSTVTFTGTGNINNFANFYNLTNSSGTRSVTQNIDVENALEVTGGQIGVTGGTERSLTMSGATSTVNIAGGAVYGTDAGVGNDLSLVISGAQTTLSGNATGSLDDEKKFFNVTVNTGSKLVLSRGILCKYGTFIVDGTLQLDANGYVQNDGSYGANAKQPAYNAATGALVYNTGGSFGNAAEWTTTNPPFNVTVQNSTAVTIAGNRSSAGTLTLTNGSLAINGNTLTLNNVSSGTGTITGSATSNLTIGGTAGTVQFTSGGTNNYLKNLTVNGSMTVGSNSLNITGGATPGTVTVTGTLNSGGYLVLRSNSGGTARVGNSSGTISGLVTVERHIPARRAWRLLAPPILSSGAPTINASWQEGQTQLSPSPALDNNPGFGTHVTGGVTGDGFDQSPSNGSSIKYLSGGSWTNVGATNTGVITDQLAYMLFVRGSRAIDLSAGIAATPDETVLRVKGNIKQGPQTLPLAATGYNLVVNPYPSAIDMHSIALANSGLINDNFKIWDPKIGGSNNVGGYVTVSRNGGNYDYAPDSRPSMSGTGSELSQYIQSGSAFFVDAISTGDVNVVESNKSASGSDNVNNPTTPDERMRVNLRSVNADATTPVVDGVLATYDAANTNAINGNDAGKLANFSTENLGMMRDGKELSIERREIIGTRDTIFLNMANMKQKNYQMEMTAQLLNHPNLLGYLEDSYLSTSTLLNLDGNTIYPFNVNATPASAAANRFMIVFKPNVPLPVTFTSIKAVQQTNDIAVEWKVDNQTNIKQYEVEKSTDGRSFANVGTQMATGANGTAATYNWLDVHAVSGDNFYRVKSVGFGGDVQYTRIVKVRMGKGVPAITVYPNPVTDRVVTLQFTDMVKGNYTINLVNNLGQTVQSKLISHNGANAAQSFAIDRAVAKGNYQLQIIKPGGEKEVMKLVIAE